jgi:hypothetical protein
MALAINVLLHMWYKYHGGKCDKEPEVEAHDNLEDTPSSNIMSEPHEK